MTDPAKVAAARIEVERAKGELLETVGELMDRFQPHNLFSDLWDHAKTKGADLAEDAVDAVARRPVALGSAVAAVTMFLAREPIKDAVVTLYDAMTSKKKEPGGKAAALKQDASPKPAATGAGPQARTASRATPKRKKTEKT